ncbi:MAG: hypothetical protein IPP90_00630 [Gemmatimonadaceae bacterium]|nr:hypothetical protein [Gemmatimonadaceae bacterium]
MTLVKSIGRRGSGPGEFQSVGGIFSLPGDSIMAFDPTSNRLLVYDGALGNAIDQVLSEWVAKDNIQTTVAGRFRDGRLVGIRRRRVVNRTATARIAADTPVVVVGMPSYRPEEFVRLPIRRYVAVGEGPARYRISLDEIATVVGAVCDEASSSSTRRV